LDFVELNRRWYNRLVKTESLKPVLDRTVTELPQDYYYKQAALLILNNRLLRLLGEKKQRTLLVTVQESLPLDLDPADFSELEGKSYMLVNDPVLPSEVKQHFQKIPALKSYEVLLPLKVGDEFYGLLLMSEKASENLPTLEELENLSAVANQLAMAFHNSALLSDARGLAETNRRLRLFTERIVEHEEQTRAQERRNVAEIIHADVLQYLSQLHRDLDQLKGLGSDRLKMLESVIAKLRNLNYSLMSVHITHDFVKSLAEMVDRFRKDNPLICFSMDIEDEQQILDKITGEDHKIALFRVIEEALSNACKHSRAQHVQVKLIVNELFSEEVEQDKPQYLIEAMVIDDGIGMDNTQIPNSTDLIENHHFGMGTIYWRIYQLKGEVEFYTGQGEGMRVVVSLLIGPGKTGKSFGFDPLIAQKDQKNW
jgi:signal transduction histidine kinase